MYSPASGWVVQFCIFDLTGSSGRFDSEFGLFLIFLKIILLYVFSQNLWRCVSGQVRFALFQFGLSFSSWGVRLYPIFQRIDQNIFSYYQYYTFLYEWVYQFIFFLKYNINITDMIIDYIFITAFMGDCRTKSREG